MDKRLGYLLVAISAVAFGAMAIFARLAYASGVDTPTLLFMRFTVATVVLSALLMIRRRPLPRGRVLAGLFGMGVFGYAGQAYTFFTALTLASAGLVALLLYLYPAMVTILAAIVLGERLGGVKIGALGLALVGMALAIGPAGQGQPLGIAMAVLSAAIYSVYIVVGSRFTSAAGPLPAATVIIAASALVYLAVVAARGPVWPATTLGWAAVGAAALISTVVSVLTFFGGLERIGPTSTVTISTLEPIVTVALAAVVLDETIAGLQVAGGALIVGAVLLLTRARA